MRQFRSHTNLSPVDLRIRFPPLRLLSRTFPRNQTRCPGPPCQSRRREVMEDTHNALLRSLTAPWPIAARLSSHSDLPRVQNYPISHWQATQKCPLLFFLPSIQPLGLGFPQLGAPHPPADPAKPRSAGERSCRGSAQVRSRLTKLQARGSLKLFSGSFYWATVRAPWMKLLGTHTA